MGKETVERQKNELTWPDYGGYSNNYSTTSYGNQGGAGDGGFMAGGGSQNSPSGGRVRTHLECLQPRIDLFFNRQKRTTVSDPSQSSKSSTPNRKTTQTSL